MDLISSAFICHSQDKDTQVRLEMKHRKEEDDLYRKFARQREQEEIKMKEEFRVRKLPIQLTLIQTSSVCHTST
jgi:hypothetical protein